MDGGSQCLTLHLVLDTSWINTMFAKTILVLGFAAAVLADSAPRYSYNAPQQSAESYESYEEGSYEDAKYDFDWSVKDDSSENDFGQQESRDGDRTEGSYYVQLPDGRLQKVSYYVDGDSGFVAEVSYEGEARYDSAESRESREYSAPRPRPSYSAPRPAYSSPEESDEDSDEVYVAPRPVYSAPRTGYGAPRN